MYESAKKYATDGLGFSTIRMTASLAPTWVPSSASESTTFCSELCANVLCTGGMLPDTLDTSRVTPSGLHRLLSGALPVTAISAAQPVSARSVALDFK